MVRAAPLQKCAGRAARMSRAARSVALSIVTYGGMATLSPCGLHDRRPGKTLGDVLAAIRLRA